MLCLGYNQFGDIMNKITRIVLTGAPSSGKTNALPKIKEHFEALGYNVIAVDESATVVINNGVSRDNVFNFEYEVAKKQLKLEEQAEQSAKSLNGDTIIFYDRGLTDCFSYLTDEEIAKLQEKLGINIVDSWSRYDAVILLETAGFNGHYVNNDIREESREDAINLHQSLLRVYTGHQHLRYIAVQDSFDEKVENVIDEIKDVVSGVELEKKYLIKYPNINLFQKYAPCKSEIEQIYLLSDVGSHRIRKRVVNGTATYYETLKIRISGDSSNEMESIISVDRYNELKQNADPDMHPIIKNRYYFLYDGQYFEMDVFPFWSDKAFLELELNSVNQKRGISLPPEIELIEDVSTKKEYKNAYLARNL